MWFSSLLGSVLLLQFFSIGCSAVVLFASKANFSNFDVYKVTLVQYYADWCHFSRQLTPIFETASNAFLNHTQRGEVCFVRVDCESSSDLCAEEGIRKYPTLKVRKYGVRVKKEYRGSRTPEALINFVNENLSDNLTVIDGNNATAKEMWSQLTDTRDMIIGLFPSLDPNSLHLAHFRKAAFLERENCSFRLVHNLFETSERLAYREAASNEVKEVTILKQANFPTIYKWIQDRCIAPVRELTFANAEEIADEGLPFLLLFYDAKSAHLKRRFHELVKNHLQQERQTVNFLTADGLVFSHPLSHLNKSPKDLPLICIDSLVHMYQHPLPVETILSDPSYLKQFVADLHSQKLHREFHYGPDSSKQNQDQGASVVSTPKSDDAQSTTPPESVFKRLGPSPRHYSMIHDEF